jgi:hypothetical protein
MVDSIKIYLGSWIHPDQGTDSCYLWTLLADISITGWLLTVTSFWNRFIQFFVGFLFGIVQPQLEHLVSHLLGWIVYLYMQHGPRITLPDGPSQPVREQRDDGQQPGDHISRAARTCVGSLIRFLDTIRVRAQAVGPKAIAGIVTLAGIAYAIAGDLVTSIPTDSSALSNADICGQWDLPANASPAAEDAEQLFQAQKEIKSAAYAGRCYVDDHSSDSASCNAFAYNRVAAIKSEGNQACPFVDHSYCDQTGDGFNAETFTTDAVKAQRIGIKTREDITFNRTTTCVPLNIYQGFVKKLSDSAGHWGYELGPVASDEYSSNFTFSQYGDPFEWDVRSYTMRLAK